jgi:hypothetical protein
MLVRGEFLNLRWNVVLVDTSLLSVSINIGELVDSQGVFLVEWHSIEAFASRDSFGRG